MSEQTNQAEQNTMAHRELRERILEELEASKQAIAELSDEELEEVAGGFNPWTPFNVVGKVVDAGHAVGKGAKTFWKSQVSKSGAAVLSATGVGVGITNSK